MGSRSEKDVARLTGQLEGTENRESADPGNGPLMREGGYDAKSNQEIDDDDEDE